MSVAEILTKDKELSAEEYQDLLEQGIRKEQFTRIAKAVASVKALTEISGMSQRSLARLKPEEAITEHASEVVLSLVRIILLGSEVFGSVDSAAEWLNRPNRALRDRPPLVLLKNRFGAEEVRDVLVRLEHGVYS